jgi:hypothetical protein
LTQQGSKVGGELLGCVLLVVHYLLLRLLLLLLLKI